MSEKPQTPAHAAAIRRDERNAKSPDVDVRATRRRNMRRWCRGIEGVEHTPKCVTYDEVKSTALGGSPQVADWRILVCTTCGKELDHYYPMNWLILNLPVTKPKPEWVTK